MNTVSPMNYLPERYRARSLSTLTHSLVVALACLLGCKRSTSDAPLPSTSSTVLAPVPTPPALAAELIVPNPDGAWSALRDTLGGDAILAPRSVGGLLVSLFGLPLRAAQEFDETLPAVGALAGEKDARVAIAFHVRGGGTFVTLLTSGADATFDAAHADGLAKLIPRATARSGLVPGAALAIIGNYLVIGNGFDAVGLLGPYLVRTLATRPAAAHAGTGTSKAQVAVHAEGAAFGQLLGRWLDARVAELDGATRTKLAPFFDVAAAATALGATLSKAVSTDASVTFGKEGAHLEATARLSVPDAPDAPDARPLSAGKTLATLPEDTFAAIAFANSSTERKAYARTQADGLSLVIPAMGKGASLDGAKLAAALSAVADGRGDRTTIGARCTGAGVTGFAAGDVRDRKTLERGVSDLLALRSEPAMQAQLDGAGLEASLEKGRLELVTDDVWLVRFAPKKKDDPRAPVDLRFTVSEARYIIGAGVETVETLQGFYRPDPSRTLGAIAEVRSALDAAAAPTWWTLFVDPVGFAACQGGKPGAKSGAPVVVSFGPTAGGLHLRIDSARAALAFAARSLLQ